MARKGEISTRFKLEGEREFNAAIKDAANNIKVLNSEQKLAEAQFNATGDAEGYAAEKARILKDKIAEQKKIVEACQAAIQKMTDDGVKESSEEMVKWKTKLNNAKTSLFNLEAQLGKTETSVDDTGKEMKDAGKESDDYKGKLNSLKEQVNLLDEEQKLAQSEFQKTGDKQAFAASKAEILKKKIEAQKEQVAVCEEAIKSLTENGVDPNSEEVVKWKTKLTQAKTTLNNLESELSETEKGVDSTGSEMKDAGKESDDYKGKLSSLKEQVNLLDEEQKLAQSEFQKTGDKQAYAASKAEILKKKIEAQKEQVAVCEEAIKSLTDNGVDPNSEEVVKWKTKLTQAKTTLNNMEGELEDVESGLEDTNEDMETGTEDSGQLNEALKKIGDDVTFDTLQEGLEKVTGFLEGLITKAAAAAKAVWDATIDASEWADEVSTNAATFGIDAETYQAMVYASRFVDTSADKIFGSITRLEKDMGDGGKELMETFNQLGIVTRNANGSVRDSEQVFWDTIDALGRVEDETQRSIYAQRIFGSSWEELNPLIREGSKSYKDYMDIGRQVAVVSNENVEALSTLSDSYEDLSAVWEKTKIDTLAALAPVMTEVADALKAALQALNEFIASEEGQQALTSLREALTGIISSFLGDDNGQESFKAIVDKAKEAVKGFTGALQWIADNGETVKNIILGLAGAWAACKVSSTVLSFLKFANALSIGKLNALGGALTAAGGNAAAGAAVTGSAGSAALSGAGGAAAGTAGTTLMGVAAPAALTVGGLAAIGYLVHTGWNERMTVKKSQNEATKGALWEEAEEIGDTKFAEAWDAVDAARETIRTADEVTAELVEAVTSTPEFQKAAELTGMQGADWVKMWETGGANALIQVGDSYGGAFGAMKEKLDELSLEAWEKAQETGETLENVGENAASGFADGLTEGEEDVKDASTELAAGAVDAANTELDSHSPSRVFENIGANAAVGMANGIYARGWEAINAAKWLADSITATIQGALQIHSPSRVMEGLGEFAGIGFAEGIEGSVTRVKDAVGRMVSTTARRAARPAYGYASAVPGIPGNAQGGSAGGAGNYAAVIMMDKTVVGRMVAPAVNDTIGAQISAMRR